MIRPRPTIWITLTAAMILALWLLLPTFENFDIRQPSSSLFIALSLGLVLLFVGLAGVLIRNLVRLFVARKRGILGSRLQTKLVFFFLGLVFLPSTVLFIGSARVIKETVEALARTPLEELRDTSRDVIARWDDYFCEQSLGRAHGVATRTRELELLRPSRRRSLDEELARWRDEHDLESVGIVVDGEPVARAVSATFEGAAALRAVSDRTTAELLRALQAGDAPPPRLENVDQGVLVHAVVPLDPGGDPSSGAVIITDLLPAFLTGEIDGLTDAVRAYGQFRDYRGEVVNLYLTSLLLIFLATLLIASWIGFYLSRRISVPMQQLASATREIAAGNLDVRVDAQVGDEVGALVDAFNEMAGELQESREVITKSTADLRASNRALDERRRTIETLVENLSTGVVSLDPDGRVTTINSALNEILSLDLQRGDEVRPALREAGLQQIDRMLPAGGGKRAERQDMSMEIDGRIQQLVVQASPLRVTSGEVVGTLLMVEDLSDLMQAQRAAAWREVARRIAHEIKNPLTPIQLSAQRLRKKLTEDRDELARILPESTEAIEREVATLKQLVDEFSRFARMPEIRPEPVRLGEIVDGVLQLYEGTPGLTIDVRLDPSIETVRLDPQQMRRALINLVDNSLAAMDGEGRIAIEAQPVGRHAIKLSIADDGPGIPKGDRDRLFAPYFSTKKRGTGLGLAIVYKVVKDHQGTIRVEDNDPHGARFVIEIPA